MSRFARLFAIAILASSLSARASWITNLFNSPGGASSTIKVVFTPTNTPIVLSNGTIVYSTTVTAYATNGVLSPTWVQTGGYVVTFGPQSDTLPNVGVPYDSNTYSLWFLSSNSVTVTNFPQPPGVSGISISNEIGAVGGIGIGNVGPQYYITFTNGPSSGAGPFVLDPQTGLSYTLFLTNDNGVLTPVVGTNGYILGTNNASPFLFNSVNSSYYQLQATNDNGVLTLQFSTNSIQ